MVERGKYDLLVLSYLSLNPDFKNPIQKGYSELVFYWNEATPEVKNNTNLRGGTFIFHKKDNINNIQI